MCGKTMLLLSVTAQGPCSHPDAQPQIKIKIEMQSWQIMPSGTSEIGVHTNLVLIRVFLVAHLTTALDLTYDGW